MFHSSALSAPHTPTLFPPFSALAVLFCPTLVDRWCVEHLAARVPHHGLSKRATSLATTTPVRAGVQFHGRATDAGPWNTSLHHLSSSSVEARRTRSSNRWRTGSSAYRYAPNNIPHHHHIPTRLFGAPSIIGNMAVSPHSQPGIPSLACQYSAHAASLPKTLPVTCAHYHCGLVPFCRRPATARRRLAAPGQNTFYTRRSTFAGV